MREIFVVTHPEATHHVEHRVGGWYDSVLTERGHAHARRIADALADRVRPGAALFSSDLRRTAQTAAAVAERLGLGVRHLPELREKTYGVAGGQPDDWFRERFVPPPATGDRLDHDEGIEGAETRRTWIRRVYAGMDVVAADPAEQKVVVTHGGSATLVIAHWIGMPPDALTHAAFDVDPGSITHLAEDDRFANHHVVRLNDTRHLVD